MVQTQKPVLALGLAAMIAAGQAIFMTGSAQAQKPKVVPSGNCKAMVAATGGKGIWVGQYSGRAQDESSDWVYPFFGKGCFKSEYECRRWANEMLSAANGIPGAHSCKPYQ